MSELPFSAHACAGKGFPQFRNLCLEAGLALNDFDVRPHVLDRDELLFTFGRRKVLLASRGDDTTQIDGLIVAVQDAPKDGRLSWAIVNTDDQEVQVLLLDGYYIHHLTHPER